MANPKLSTLQDPFTGSVINTALWSNITSGAASLDQVNDLVVLAMPTTSGAMNSFGSSTLFDATGSQIYAEVGAAANGNGNTNTIFRLSLDSNNYISLQVASGGAFQLNLKIAGVQTSTVLPAYDPNAHGWWRLRESSGVFYADVSADGLNWANAGSAAYSWNATAVVFKFATSAGGAEVAGNVATIQHANTMGGGPFNINWPTLEEAWAPFWNCNGGDIPLDRYVDLTSRTEGQSSTTRGRQYETDQIEAGTATFTAQNKDGVLDPDNAAGPYFGHIEPAQPYRKRAQWPPTRNLLTQVQATAGDLGGQPLGTIDRSNSGPSIFTATDTTHGSFVASASAWQGGTVMQFAVPAATAPVTEIVYTPQPAVTPGTQYTEQIQARNVTASTAIQVWAYIATYNAAGTGISTHISAATTLTGGTAPAWTPLTVSATLDAATAFIHVGLMVAVAPTSTVAVQVDGWQLEKATAASTWCCPGVWYPWASGFTDEWAAAWTNGGTYGTITPTTYDTFGLLSQRTLLDALTQEITNHNPRFLYQLDDPAGSTAATDATGQNPAAPLTSSKYGAGSAVFGTSITAANTTTGIYVGSGGTVLTFNNPNPGQNGNQASTVLSLSGAGIKGPANPLLWTRMLAFRYTGAVPPVGGSANIWGAVDGSHATGAQFSLYIDSNGHLNWLLSGPASGGALSTATTFSVADSNWHLAMVAYDGTGTGFLQYFVDGASIGSYSVGPAYAPTGLVGDNLGAYLAPANGAATSNNFKGDVSFVAEFPTLLNGTDASGLYTAWRSACAGESTDARYSRILRYAQYIGQSSIQTGLTTSMGAAAFAGQDALSALRDVVATENGTHFVARDGTVTFQSRSTRYNSLTPMYTFGERADLGEWPYEDAQPTRDTAHLANIVQVTQTSTGQVFSAANAAAQVSYFPKTLTRDINSTNTFECQDAANYLLSRYVNPVTRIQTLVLHPSAMPAMWPVCLSLELGMRIRVMRRPPAAPPIVVDCFIEKIDTSNDDAADATWTLQCSPVDLTPYGVFASFHTTLHTTVASGVTSITINAGADNTNLAAAQIGPGQHLVLGQNSANQETVTVLSVAATSPGWTTCVITLTAATAKSHAAGDVICEPLPTGVTDPTTWDNVSMFDGIAFAY